MGWVAGAGGEIRRTTCNNTSASITVDACESYTVPSGDTTYTTSGTYGDTIYNEAACDSILTIDLTIDGPVDTSVSKVSASELQADEDTASYQWLDCDNGYAPISGETGQSFTPSSDGNYAVELTNGSCIDTSGCHSLMASNLRENSSGITPVYYPNPTEKGVTIELDRPNGSIVVILRDMQGRRIRMKHLEDPSRFKLQLGSRAGVYHVELHGSNGENASFRVLKER